MGLNARIRECRKTIARAEQQIASHWHPGGWQARKTKAELELGVHLAKRRFVREQKRKKKRESRCRNTSAH